MATQRDNPYGAFNYIVSIGDAQGDGSAGTVIGGFSDVSGLGVGGSYSHSHSVNQKFNTTRKVPNTHKLDDITLKRGIMGSDDLFAWLKGVRDGTADPRQITITLLDEARNAVVKWAVRNAQPKKWAGPTLAAKGGGEVAMEELHLVHEGIEFK